MDAQKCTLLGTNLNLKIMSYVIWMLIFLFISMASVVLLVVNDAVLEEVAFALCAMIASNVVRIEWTSWQLNQKTNHG